MLYGPLNAVYFVHALIHELFQRSGRQSGRLEWHPPRSLQDPRVDLTAHFVEPK